MALNAILKKHACTGGGWWSTQNTIYTVYIYIYIYIVCNIN